MDRRNQADSSCVVCGVNDARLLSYTRLEDGARVTVCGSHRVAHRRSDQMARSVEELRELTGERRTG